MNEPTFTKDQAPFGYYRVSQTCTNGCGAVVEDVVRAEDVFKWRNGLAVQHAFAYLTATARETLFVSGVCGTCWTELTAFTE